jgi:hypothetical protein
MLKQYACQHRTFAVSFQFDMCNATNPTTTTTTDCAVQTSLLFLSSLHLPPELWSCHEANDIMMDEGRQLADMTTQQSTSQQRHDARRPRLTASVFGDIVKQKAAFCHTSIS